MADAKAQQHASKDAAIPYGLRYMVQHTTDLPYRDDFAPAEERKDVALTSQDQQSPYDATASHWQGNMPAAGVDRRPAEGSSYDVLHGHDAQVSVLVRCSGVARAHSSMLTGGGGTDDVVRLPRAE